MAAQEAVDALKPNGRPAPPTHSMIVAHRNHGRRRSIERRSKIGLMPNHPLAALPPTHNAIDAQRRDGWRHLIEKVAFFNHKEDDPLKNHRPYIPLAIRIIVAERQVRERFGTPFLGKATLAYRLRWALTLLSHLGLTGKLELHHRPALCNRPFDGRDYEPRANNPDYLIYLPKGDHDIETRVRGLGAQRSDQGQRRYLKRVARNRDPKRKRRSWPKRKLSSKAINPRWRRRRWPSRPLRSRTSLSG